MSSVADDIWRLLTQKFGSSASKSADDLAGGATPQMTPQRAQEIIEKNLGPSKTQNSNARPQEGPVSAIAKKSIEEAASDAVKSQCGELGVAMLSQIYMESNQCDNDALSNTLTTMLSKQVAQYSSSDQQNVDVLSAALNGFCDFNTIPVSIAWINGGIQSNKQVPKNAFIAECESCTTCSAYYSNVHLYINLLFTSPVTNQATQPQVPRVRRDLGSSSTSSSASRYSSSFNEKSNYSSMIFNMSLMIIVLVYFVNFIKR